MPNSDKSEYIYKINAINFSILIIWGFLRCFQKSRNECVQNWVDLSYFIIVLKKNIWPFLVFWSAKKSWKENKKLVKMKITLSINWMFKKLTYIVAV